MQVRRTPPLAARLGPSCGKIGLAVIARYFAVQPLPGRRVGDVSCPTKLSAPALWEGGRSLLAGSQHLLPCVRLRVLSETLCDYVLIRPDAAPGPASRRACGARECDAAAAMLGWPT